MAGRVALVRADATWAMGSGHLMRCLALASAMSPRGWRVRFVVAETADALAWRIEAEGHALLRLADVTPGGEADLKAVVATARRDGARLAIIDGYHFGPEYQERLRDVTGRLVQVDDLAEAVGVADAIVNPGLHAEEATYRRRARSGATLLLGPRYALLRDAFRQARRRLPSERAAQGRLLVTMGGADPVDMTARVAEVVVHHRDLPVATIVVGSAYKRLAELERLVSPLGERVEILVDEPQIEHVMMQVDLAVAAAGGTAWELCCLGVPSLLVALAPNQIPVSASAAAAGVAIDLGWHGDVEGEQIADGIRNLANDPARRAEMSKRGRALVDGEGAERVAEVIANDAE